MERVNRSFVIVQISDLHLDGTREIRPRLDALFSSIAQRMQEFRSVPDRILLITGDIVDDPKPEAFREAEELLDRARGLEDFTDVAAVAGNHDVKRMGLIFKRDEAYERLKLPRGAKNRYYDKSGLDLVLLDSNGASFAKGRVGRDSYDGFVESAAKLNLELKQAVENRAGQEFKEPSRSIVRVIALHHHPLPLAPSEGKTVYGIPDEPFTYLTSPATFLTAAISVDASLILHGHQHVNGLARYSVPNPWASTSEISDEFWKTLYVLACPSSTGKDCEAGFNIVQFGPVHSFGRISYRYDITRYIRRNNAGAFEPLDSCPSGLLHLPVGKDYHRDPAIQILIELSSTQHPSREEVLNYAKRLLRRRAFYADIEQSWPHATFAYGLTHRAWVALQSKFDQATTRQDQALARQIASFLYELVELCGQTLGLDGYELDELRRHLDDQEKFLPSIRRVPAPGIDATDADAKRIALVRRINQVMVDLGEDLGLGCPPPADVRE